MEGNNGTGEGKGVSWGSCRHLKRLPWLKNGGCKHINEFVWCCGCPERDILAAITVKKGGSYVDKSGC